MQNAWHGRPQEQALCLRSPPWIRVHGRRSGHLLFNLPITRHGLHHGAQV
eukprot:CAMPEP_0204208638 /NCGR_PEP_ID=MMETSP0361-20130328/72630_1 /ASSEMBLY_ACC=CAM_ASM_000343 /TAXON_ID=268821 /ORGANISM="Scrippsiella Hangoei, Strain SHTV-5" /LENGTH=49 /DNA_ID= /DNA_START= /DNA_END= /DNA_ORIENTATION=